MKSIACVISSLKLGGGAERVISNLANRFSRKGCKVYVITTYRAEQEYPLDESIERYNILDNREQYNFVQRNRLHITFIRRFCKENKVNLCLSFMPESNMRNLIATFGIATKAYVSERTDPKFLYPTFMKKLLVRCLYGLADGIIFQTEEARDFFRNKKIKKNSAVIINSIDNKFLNHSDSGIHRDIITLGRLVSYKNHQMLIRAFDLIKQEIPDEKLFIYGEGEERNNLEKLIEELDLKDRVFLPGNKKDIIIYLEKAKLFVLSSDYEGMPNALMEAMALGIPSISTDCPCGGSRYLINRKECGRLVPVGDIKQLADSMKELLKNDEELRKIGHHSSDRMKEFNEENVTELWTGFLKIEE